MTAPTQNQRVLVALKRAGKKGITQLDFVTYPAIDNQGPILRLPARIADLRRAGHAISSRLETVGKARVARYRIISSPDRPPAAPATPGAAAQDALLDLGEFTSPHRPRSALDPDLG